MSSNDEPEARYITTLEAAKRARMPIWTARRILQRINERTGGKLLYSPPTPTGRIGKWMVNVQVLDEELLVERSKRQGLSIREEVDRALTIAQENAADIKVLNRRTEAHTKRIRSQGVKIEKVQEEASKFRKFANSIGEAVRANTEALQALGDTPEAEESDVS